MVESETWVNIGIATFGFLSGAVISVMSWFKKRKRSTQNPLELTSIHSEIHERLSELRVATNSIRVRVGQFHNGEYFLDGSSMRKFSVTHQSLAIGVSSALVNGILISLITEKVMIMRERDPKIRHVSDLPASYTKSSFESRNVSQFSIVPIMSPNHDFSIGYLCVEWGDEVDIPEDREAVIKKVAETANLVSGLLAVRKV